MREEELTTADGRSVAYCVIGVDSRLAPTIVYFHGAPSSRYELVDDEPSIIAAGARVLALDRPGYGRSTLMLSRAIDDHVIDVGQVLQMEGIQRFGAVGVSSGAPYALACGALIPTRVDAATIVAGVTDFAWEGAWTGYDELECQVMRQASAESAIAWCEQRFGQDGRGLWTELTGDTDSSPDSSFGEATRQGVAGYAHDIWLQARPWKFSIAALSAPTRVYHGDADTTVPIGHGVHSASLIPQAHFEVMPGYDHVGACSQVSTLIAQMVGARGR